MLGSLDWEGVLGNALKRPLLRLPDFPKRPGERAEILECALFVDAAHDAPEQDIVRRVRVVSQSVLDSSNRAVTRLHIFTTVRWFSRLKFLGADSRVTVHDPSAAEQSARDDVAASNMPLRSAAWWKWATAALDGRGLDAVHLICRSSWNDTVAELQFPVTPWSHEASVTMMTLDFEELNLLFNRAGAWAVTFVPATAAQRDSMAYIADNFARRRPGAVLFHSLNDPSDDASFGVACRLLFGGGTTTPPLYNGFLYCHPGFIYDSVAQTDALDGTLLDTLVDSARLLAQQSPLADRLLASITRILPGVETVEPAIPPNWLGATQRFLESALFEEVRRSAADVLLSRRTEPPAVVGRPNDEPVDAVARQVAPPQLPAPENPAVNDILSEIQSVVKNYSQQKKG
jgi:hypothetical protein